MLRLVITIPLASEDAAEAAYLLDTLADSDLGPVADELRQLGTLQVGAHGWTADPDTHDVRVHWAIKDRP